MWRGDVNGRGHTEARSYRTAETRRGCKWLLPACVEASASRDDPLEARISGACPMLDADESVPHCTNNQHKTWMTVGMAMRVAQSIGCHLPETLLAQSVDHDRQLKKRVWVSCVALDRYVKITLQTALLRGRNTPPTPCDRSSAGSSMHNRCVNWVVGKTSAPSLLPLHGHSPADATFPGGKNTDPLIRGLELHEIGNQIQLAQTGAWSQLGPSLGLPQLYEQKE